MQSPVATCRTPRSTWAARGAAALAIGAACWLIGHSFDYSARAEVAEHHRADRIENEFAAKRGANVNSAVGFFLLGGVGVACWLTSDRKSNWSQGLLWLGGAYFAWCGLSLLWSTDAQQSIQKLAILGLTLLGAVGVSLRFDLEDQLWIFVLVLGGLVGLGVLAEFANGTFRPWRPDFRFSGTCHPNDQGLQCALLALAAGFAAWTAPGRSSSQNRSALWGDWLRRALVGAALAGLWLSRSRTTLAAMLAAVAVAWCLRSRGLQRWLAVSAGVAMLSALALGACFSSVATLNRSIDVATMGRRQDLNSLTGRLPLWEAMVEAAADRPLLGCGFGAFWNQRNVLKYSNEFMWHIPHAHNIYLDMVLETGVIGLTLYLAWALSSLAVALVRHEQTDRPALRLIVCLIVFSLVHGLAESKTPAPGIAGFMLFAALATLALHSESLAAAPIPSRVAPPRRWHATPRFNY